MGLFFKIFVGFWIVWLLWYVTGGPLRDSKPYVKVNSSGNLEPTDKASQ